MNEKELLLSHTAEMKEKAADESVITHTKFLSVDEISTVMQLGGHLSAYVDTFFYAGYEGGERCICVFVPKFYNCEDIHAFLQSQESNPLCVIEVKKDKFCTLTHRDYLGSIIGLGISREMVGDIIVSDDGCYIFALKTISAYICENLTRVGRGTVACNVTDIENMEISQEKITETVYSVSSLRIDNFISAVFNLSRKTACECIQKGVVFVNSANISKKDFTLKPGDKVVFRGKGKAVFCDTAGNSKRGRIRIIVQKYK